MSEEETNQVIAQLKDVNRKLGQVNKRLESHELNFNELRDRIITKAHLRRRRRQVILIAIAVCSIFVVLDHLSASKCFLSPNQTGWSKDTCSAIFPGYSKARDQSLKNLERIYADHDRINRLEEQANR